MKVFKGTDVVAIEREINEWLRNASITEIHYVTHANNVSTMFLTVWWT